MFLCIIMSCHCKHVLSKCLSFFVQHHSPHHYALLFCLPNFTTMHLCLSCNSPLCTFGFHALYLSLTTTKFLFLGKPQVYSHLPLSTPHHYEHSLLGATSIYPSALRTLPPRDLYLSLTTTNSPSQRPLCIPHHYELSLPGIYPSPL